MKRIKKTNTETTTENHSIKHKLVRQQICFMVSTEIVDELDQLAKEYNNTRSDIVRSCLRVCLRPEDVWVTGERRPI